MVQRPQNPVNVLDACRVDRNTQHTLCKAVGHFYLQGLFKPNQTIGHLAIEPRADTAFTSVQHQLDKTTDRKIWHHVAIEHCELLTTICARSAFGKLNLSSLLSFFLLILMLLLGTHPNGVYRARGFLFMMQR